MKIEPGLMVPLGYGKYFRSDRIVGLEPIEEGRGPGQRTRVYIEQLASPIIASRSEGAILGDIVEMPKEITKIREQRELLSDLVDTISEINPLLRSIIRDQGKWDFDRLEERIRDVLRQDEEIPSRKQVGDTGAPDAVRQLAGGRQKQRRAGRERQPSAPPRRRELSRVCGETQPLGRGGRHLNAVCAGLERSQRPVSPPYGTRAPSSVR